MKNDLKTVESKKMKIQGKVLEMEDEIKTLQGEEAPLRQHIESHNQELLNLDVRHKEIKNEISRLHGELRHFGSDESSLSLDIKDKKQELTNVSDRIDAEKRRIQNDTA